MLEREVIKWKAFSLLGNKQIKEQRDVLIKVLGNLFLRFVYPHFMISVFGL